MKQIVVPGDMVNEAPSRISHCYVDGGKTYSMVLGIYDSESRTVVPLEGVWDPKIDEVVVGVVKSVKNKVYEVDLNHHERSIIISGKFDRISFRTGDVVEARIKDVENKKTIILQFPRLLSGGTVIEVKPAKVPRIVGKGNTMINQISEATGSRIVVGKNGRIWISGGDVGLVTRAIARIEMEAHVSGLTERIKKMLEEETRR
jgi:exosome complex component RRP4